MTRPTDAVRSAVRRALAQVPDPGPDPLALVACSGGADSLALAAGAARAARGARWRVGAVIVDHRLQAGSGDIAERVRQQCVALGLSPVLVSEVEVGSVGGPEAAARTARYGAFDQAAAGSRARAVMLAHTLDDQAETVLLGLARGSGARSLQGMPQRSQLPCGAVLLRPALGLRREVMEQACAGWHLQPWQDPHNTDRRYTRVRVRLDVMPVLTAALGPGAPLALARTAAQLRDDEALLSDLASRALAQFQRPVACAQIAALAPSLRRRILRELAAAAGCPAADLTTGHLNAMDAAVLRGGGAAQVRLPGGVTAAVRCGRLVLAVAPGQE